MTIDSAQLSLINAHYMLYLILAITLSEDTKFGRENRKEKKTKQSQINKNAPLRVTHLSKDTAPTSTW